MTGWQVLVNDRDKGVCYVKHGRWRWRRNNAGIDTFPKGTKRDDLKPFIARVFLVEQTAVVFVRTTIEY